jgi:hypothetical protein
VRRRAYDRINISFSEHTHPSLDTLRFKQFRKTDREAGEDDLPRLLERVVKFARDVKAG